MRNIYGLTLMLGFFLSACGQNNSSSMPSNEALSTAKLPEGAIVVPKGGGPVHFDLKLSLIESYSDIENVMKGDDTYKQFLQESWKAADKVVAASTDNTKIRAQAGSYATCAVDIDTFSSSPIVYTVSGSYSSTCASFGDARVVYGNHTLQVQNTNNLRSNAITRSSATGNIYFLGAPVQMTFGGDMYCAKGFISVRDALGLSYSGVSPWICNYYVY